MAVRNIFVSRQKYFKKSIDVLYLWGREGQRLKIEISLIVAKEMWCCAPGASTDGVFTPEVQAEKRSVAAALALNSSYICAEGLGCGQ